MLRHVVMLALMLSTVLPAGVITFEELSEGDLVGANYNSLTFTNAIILTAASFLNDFEFPPASGVNVVSDLGGPISIYFTSPVTFVGASLTYGVSLSLSAFDSANQLLGSVFSIFSNNEALSGDAGSLPNEILSITSASAIDHVTFAGADSGGSFVLDDLSFAAQSGAAPEPGNLMLLLGGLVLMVGGKVCSRWNGLPTRPATRVQGQNDKGSAR